MTYTVDQNCHSLWDVLPKLQALTRKGKRVRHFIEDIDVAFTAMGAGAGRTSSAAGALRLALERYHRSGGSDWGAALFYSEFLGRLPVEIRDLEPPSGMKTNVLARRLGRSIDELYDEFSPGDNWQLIGPSYVGGDDHHRIIGDLSVAETAGFLREVMEKAQADMRERFPSPEPQKRLEGWFAREKRLLEDLLARHAGGRLVELYAGWLAAYVPAGPQFEASFTSELFAIGRNGGRTALLEIFTRDYGAAARLYNEALAETDSPLRPLRTGDGELPFFAVLEHEGHLVRAAVHLRGGEVCLAGSDGGFALAPDGRLPVAELAAAGVRALAGKAIVLTIQVRLSPGGAPLAVPYGGSIYMPASVCLAEKLEEAEMLPGRLHPIVRVRFRLLDRLRSLQTPIRLPEHLAACFGREEVPARELGENHKAMAAEAAARLESFKDEGARRKWQRRSFPDLFRRMEELDALRRRLAAEDPKGPEIRRLGKEAKALAQSLLAETFRSIWRDHQVSRIDYWDSRGAIFPWCVALGGEDFYNQVLEGAEIYTET